MSMVCIGMHLAEPVYEHSHEEMCYCKKEIHFSINMTY